MQPLVLLTVPSAECTGRLQQALEWYTDWITGNTHTHPLIIIEQQSNYNTYTFFFYLLFKWCTISPPMNALNTVHVTFIHFAVDGSLKHASCYFCNLPQQVFTKFVLFLFFKNPYSIRKWHLVAWFSTYTLIFPASKWKINTTTFKSLSS